MFYGQNRHGIDSKGRVIIPSKYREDLGECFYITRGLNDCLFVYPELAWKLLEEKLNQLPMSSGAGIKRFFFNNTEKVSLDKQGRVLVPTHLKEFAKIDKNVVIAGASDRLEIWSEEMFDKLYKEDDMSAEEITRQMELLGL